MSPTTVTRLCEACQRPFETRPAYIARGQGRFCSMRCAKFRGGTSERRGYVIVNHSHRPEHDLIVERVLGRSLPTGVIVHHVNEVKNDNRNANLCVLQSQQDHGELHRKLRVLRAGGNPWRDRLCGRCHAVKDAALFYLGQRGRSGYCIDCHRADAKARQRIIRKEKCA